MATVTLHRIASLARAVLHPPLDGQLVESVKFAVPHTAWQTVDRLLIDFRHVHEVNSEALGQLALLQADDCFRRCGLVFVNVSEAIREMMGIVGVDKLVPVLMTTPEEAAGPTQMGTLEDNETHRLALAAAEHELAQTRHQLVHLEKVGNVGQMASGVAHEFNNLIGIMSGYAELAATSLDQQAVVEESLNVILESCARASAVTQALLDFSRRRLPVREEVELNHLIQEQLRLLNSRLMANSIELDANYSAVPVRVLGDPSLLSQVFMNLITNAIDAMPEGGVLIIETRLASDKGLVVVSDTGHGISAKDRERIFTPFFTTKGAMGAGKTKGTGLGLSVSYGVIASHKGTIDVSSEEGKGTTFTITLPQAGTAPASASSTASSAPATTTPAQSLSIVVIDDEAPIRRLLETWCRQLGHRVRLAKDGPTAIALCLEEMPDVVFLDILMPGMNGGDVLLEIRRIRRDVHVAIISGQAGQALEAMLEVMQHTGAVECIRKPFKLAEVKAFLETCAPLPG